MFTADGEYLVHDINVNADQRLFFKGWQVRVWNLREGQKIASHIGGLFGVGLDGQSILTRLGREADQFQAYDLRTGTPVEPLALSPANFRFNQRYVLYPGQNNLQLVDILGKDLIREISFTALQDLDSLVLSPDGTRFVATHSFDTAGFDAAWGHCYAITGEMLFKFHDLNRFASFPLIVFAENHPLLAVETGSLTITIYDTTNGQPTYHLEFGSLGGGNFLAFNPQRSLMIAYHLSPQRWRLLEGPQHKDIHETNKIIGGAFSHDGERFAILLYGGRVRIYRVRDVSVELEMEME